MMEKDIIYIAHKNVAALYKALAGDQEALEIVAADFFDGDIKDAAGLIDFFRDVWAQQLLEEISYWGTPAEDFLLMNITYKKLVKRLNEYAAKTGYVIRWKAYNEYKGLPVPEDDVVTTWFDRYGHRTDPVTVLCAELDGGGTLILNMPTEDVCEIVQAGGTVKIDIAGEKFMGQIITPEKIPHFMTPEEKSLEQATCINVPDCLNDIPSELIPNRCCLNKRPTLGKKAEGSDNITNAHVNHISLPAEDESLPFD